MANRVIPAEVKEILSTDLTDPTITAYINAANATVTSLVGSNADLTTAQLKEIERWLAAHLIACTRERQIAKENAGQAGATYDGKSDMGLDATLYGQQVKLLDTTGTFATLESTVGLKSASIYAVTSFDDE